MSNFSFGGIIPLVPAINMDEAIQFYIQELGFSKSFQKGDHTGLKRDEVELHLYQTNDKHLADWSVIRLQTNNIENLYEQLKDKHPNAKLQLMPYGLKEVSVVDPSGVLVRFFEKP